MKNLALLALAAVAIVGCGNSSSGDNGTTTGSGTGTTGSTTTASTEGKKFRIGMCQSNNGEPYRVQMNADIMAAAKEHPELDVIVKDAQNDSLKQRDQLEEFVQDKVDLIMISPKEAVPLTAPVEKAMDAGIPVIVIDRPITSDKYTAFIGADNKKIGVALGKWLKAKLKPGAQIVELEGLMTTPVAQDRHNGFLEGMKGTDAKTLATVEMKFLEPEAHKEMESILSRFPHIDAVYAHNDPGAHGAYLAAKAAGREKEMIFVGIDALPNEGVKYVEQGIEAASFQYPTGGKEAIETALKILKKEPFDKKITLESKYFTPENVKSGGELVK
jgi:ribose transport system substrate-binding protein